MIGARSRLSTKMPSDSGDCPILTLLTIRAAGGVTGGGSQGASEVRWARSPGAVCVVTHPGRGAISRAVPRLPASSLGPRAQHQKEGGQDMGPPAPRLQSSTRVPDRGHAGVCGQGEKTRPSQ